MLTTPAYYSCDSPKHSLTFLGRMDKDKQSNERDTHRSVFTDLYVLGLGGGQRMTAIRQLWEWESSLSNRKALTGGNARAILHESDLLSRRLPR